MKNITRHTKIILGLAILLTGYGQFCRLVGFNFFWESLGIAWTLYLIAVISFLLDCVRFKRATKRNYLIESLLIGIVCFILIDQITSSIKVWHSDAFPAAIICAQNDKGLKNEVGAPTDFELAIWGNGITSDSEDQLEYASVALIVKGDKKYKNIHIYLEKKSGATNWVLSENNSFTQKDRGIMEQLRSLADSLQEITLNEIIFALIFVGSLFLIWKFTIANRLKKST